MPYRPQVKRQLPRQRQRRSCCSQCPSAVYVQSISKSMEDTDGDIPACLPSNRRSGFSVFTYRPCMLLHQHDAPRAGSALRSNELHSPRRTQYAVHNTTHKRTRSDIWQPRRTHQPPFATQINPFAMQRLRSSTLPCSALQSLSFPSPCG